MNYGHEGAGQEGPLLSEGMIVDTGDQRDTFFEVDEVKWSELGLLGYDSALQDNVTSAQRMDVPDGEEDDLFTDPEEMNMLDLKTEKLSPDEVAVMEAAMGERTTLSGSDDLTLLKAEVREAVKQRITRAVPFGTATDRTERLRLLHDGPESEAARRVVERAISHEIVALAAGEPIGPEEACVLRKEMILLEKKVSDRILRLIPGIQARLLQEQVGQVKARNEKKALRKAGLAPREVRSSSATIQAKPNLTKKDWQEARTWARIQGISLALDSTEKVDEKTFTATAREEAKLDPLVLSWQDRIDDVTMMLIDPMRPIALMVACDNARSFGGGLRTAYEACVEMLTEAIQTYPINVGLQLDEHATRFLQKNAQGKSDSADGVKEKPRGWAIFLNAMQALKKAGDESEFNAQVILDDVSAFYARIERPLPQYWTLAHIKNQYAAYLMSHQLHLDVEDESGRKALMEAGVLDEASRYTDARSREIRGAREEFEDFLAQTNSLREKKRDDGSCGCPRLHTLLKEICEQAPDFESELLKARAKADASGVENAFQSLSREASCEYLEKAGRIFQECFSPLAGRPAARTKKVITATQKVTFQSLSREASCELIRWKRLLDLLRFQSLSREASCEERRNYCQ